jgi:hypothetical protein
LIIGDLYPVEVKTTVKVVEVAPERLDTSDLAALVKWFEESLCGSPIVDPRGYKVVIGLQHFPYLIKLRDKITGEKLLKPGKKAARIRDGKLVRSDFGSIDEDRAQTLSWIRAIIERPTIIAKNKHLHVPGDEVYIKEFYNKKRNGYRYKALVCMGLSKNSLEPVTSFRKKKLGVSAEDIIWREHSEVVEAVLVRTPKQKQ